MSLVRQIRKRKFQTEGMKKFAIEHTKAFPGMGRWSIRKVVRDSMRDLWREARGLGIQASSGVRRRKVAAAHHGGGSGSGVGVSQKAEKFSEKIKVLARHHADLQMQNERKQNIFSRTFQKMRKAFTRNQTHGVGA